MQNHNEAAGGAIDASLKVDNVSRGLAQSGFHGFELGPDLVLVHALEAAPCLYRKKGPQGSRKASSAKYRRASTKAAMAYSTYPDG